MVTITLDHSITLPFWQLLHPPAWSLNRACMAILHKPVWLLNQARMAILLSLYGYSSLPIWHVIRLKKELHMHPILHMMISPTFHGTVGTLYQNQPSVPIINLFSPYDF